MSKELVLDAAYQGYIFLGWASGMFEPERDRRVPYPLSCFGARSIYTS